MHLCISVFLKGVWLKKKLTNRTKLFMVLGALGAIIFIVGLLSGFVIGSLSAKKAAAKADAESEGTVSGNDASEGPQVVISAGEDEYEEFANKVFIPARERVFGQIPINSYNTGNFYPDEDGFMAYHDEEGNTISWLGVDLSYHQENVNWDELADSGVDFVILRCGYRGYSEGGLIKDEKFDEYAKACNEKGIPLGVYFFTQAVSEEEALEEAEFVIDTIKDYEISYPVAFDTEYVSDAQARTNLNEIDENSRSGMCIAFCERIKEAGYYPMIYASENWIRRELDYETLQEYDFWAPQYLDENDFMYDFTIWQYTERGFIKGVDEEVDLDISMVDYASFVPALREAVTKKAGRPVVSNNAINGAGSTDD